MLQAFVSSVGAHQSLAYVVPDEGFEPRRHRVLEHWESERNCVVESLLHAQRLQLTGSSIGGPGTTRKRIVQQKGLHRLSCAARKELESSHPRAWLARVQQEGCVSAQVPSMPPRP